MRPFDHSGYADLSSFPVQIPIYATFFGRFFAMLIDEIILMVPLFFINTSVFDGDLRLSFFFSLIVHWIYDAWQESSGNMATVGKRAMGIKVTDLNGGKISFGQATGRHFGKIISLIILLIGYFMMLWDDKSQTLHDKMAGTLVVTEKVGFRY